MWEWEWGIFTGLNLIFSTKPLVDAIVVELRRVERDGLESINRLEYQIRKLKEGYQSDPNDLLKNIFGIPAFNLTQ